MCCNLLQLEQNQIREEVVIWTMLLNEVLLEWYGQLMVTSTINV